MTPDQAQALRVPFPVAAIGKLPKGGVMLDYVGHAAVTDRLLEVDPEWNWEPVAWAADGTPYWQLNDPDAVLWIRLTVAGVTRLGVGIVKANAGELEKQLISDALRNAAMRFGVALDLWSKEDLQAEEVRGSHPAGNSGQGRLPSLTPDNSAAAPAATARARELKRRAGMLHRAGWDIEAARAKRLLPTIAASDAEELDEWEALLNELELGAAAASPPTTEGHGPPASPAATSTARSVADGGPDAASTDQDGMARGGHPVLVPQSESDFRRDVDVQVGGQIL